MASAMAVAPTGIASAQPNQPGGEDVKQQAIEAYKKGMKAFKKDDCEEALPHFQKADELYPGAAPKFKIATCLDKLGRAGEAVEAYRELIDSKPGEKYKDEVAKAGERIAALEAELPAKITVAVTPKDAEASMKIMVDDAEVEGEVLELGPGQHEVVVMAEGFEPYEQTITVEPNEERDLPVTLTPTEPAPSPKPLPDAPPEEDVDEGPSNIPAYVTLGIAGAGVVLGVVFGVQALGAQSDFEENPTVEHADDAERAALIADMSFGVALTFGITGTVLLVSNLLADDDAPEEEGGDAIEAELVPEVTPVVGTEGGGAALTWTF